MPKLRTPVRYGSELKDIEFTDFLNLTEDVTNIIDFPVGVTNPVTDRGIASGKFLRFGDRGNLLVSRFPRFENIQLMEHEFPPNLSFYRFVFAQKVYRVFLDVYESSQFMSLVWTDLLNMVGLESYVSGSKTIIPFVGSTICFRATMGPLGYCKVRLYGLY